MAAAPTRPPDGIDIPERPTVVTSRLDDDDYEYSSGWSRRRRILVAGSVAAAGLVVALAMLLVFGGQRGSVNPGEAPLIKAEDEPIKVTPESPGGMDVPNRDILVYGRLEGTSGGKPPVERLLPEPEQPLAPPAPPPTPKPQVDVPISEAALPSEEAGIYADTDAEPPPFALNAVPPYPPAPPRGASAPEQTAAGNATAEPLKTQRVVMAAPIGSPSPVVSPSPAASPSVASPIYQVQLFASRSEDDARGAWARLKGKNTDLLGSLSPSIARADLGARGTFYRLRAGPLSSETQAAALCRSLSSRGTPCLIIRPGS